ncbi:hypothetical protein STEG23_024203, partial [Scotinomys teguina]
TGADSEKPTWKQSPLKPSMTQSPGRPLHYYPVGNLNSNHSASLLLGSEANTSL